MNDKMTELQWHLAEQDTKDFIEQLESISLWLACWLNWWRFI